MSTLLPATPTLLAFLAASLVLAVTPGPGVLYIVARTLAQGRAAGLASVGGVALGNLGNAVAASLGLAAVFAVSAAAYTVVKFAGAAYLVCLGVQALRSPAAPGGAQPLLAAQRWPLFRDGFWVALLNPKTALFFAAFLPQFVDAAAFPVLQGVTLAALFVCIAACTDSAYVALAAWCAPALRAHNAVATKGRFFSAAVYFGLGLYALLADARAGRTATAGTP